MTRPAVNNEYDNSSIDVSRISGRYDFKKPYDQCKNATPKKVEFYRECLPDKNGSGIFDAWEPNSEPFVNIEGPEFEQDYSFFNYGLCKELFTTLELGIPIVPFDFMPTDKPNNLENGDLSELKNYFKSKIDGRNIDMEFRILNRITLHLDHGENFVRYDLA